ncbi:MAG: FMN-binding protein [Acidobacteria bacterium]|nr:FMN-binding protein [Acidobacteriota bacterium]
MRWPFLVLAFLLGAFVVVDGQAPDAKLQAQLKQIFPAATSFSPKGGSPPHFKAYRGDPAAPESLLGYVFWTTELMPLERGYDGPIRMLVGLDTKGVLAGVIVTDHNEPYGRFSVEPPAFAAQFKGKSLRDAFRVGVDIDAVSTATISVTSATRAIRNSALKMARQFLAPLGTTR